VASAKFPIQQQSQEHTNTISLYTTHDMREDSYPSYVCQRCCHAATMIADCQERLGIVAASMASELAKPRSRRRQKLLLFLYKEREVYSYSLTLLKRLVEGP
jgi:hypothetical protein